MGWGAWVKYWLTLLDFIQEDVDAMQNEYDLWTEELENNLAQIKQFQT